MNLRRIAVYVVIAGLVISNVYLFVTWRACDRAMLNATARLFYDASLYAGGASNHVCTAQQQKQEHEQYQSLDYAEGEAAAADTMLEAVLLLEPEHGEEWRQLRLAVARARAGAHRRRSPPGGRLGRGGPAASG